MLCIIVETPVNYSVHNIIILLLLCENVHVLSCIKYLQGTVCTMYIHCIIIFARKTTINNRIEKTHAGFVTQSL